MPLNPPQGSTCYAHILRKGRFCPYIPQPVVKLCHLAFNSVYLYQQGDPILSSPSENTHTTAKHLNKIFLMKDADVASWNAGIAVSSRISSVIVSNHDLKCQEDQVLRNKNWTTEGFWTKKGFLNIQTMNMGLFCIGLYWLIFWKWNEIAFYTVPLMRKRTSTS